MSPGPVAMDIASMLEVEVQEVADSKENVTPVKSPQQSFPCQTYSKEENDFYRLTYGSDVAAVRFLRLHCTGCDEHIGSAPAESHNMHEHPVLRTLLCAKCREFYGDGTFEQGDDATDMFCRWCANGGNLYCCSYCSNTFCSKCIKRNFDPPTIKRIEAEDSWKCFVCDPKDLYPLRSIARALVTHIETVTRILENDRRMSTKEIEEKMHLDETKCCSRKRKRRRRRTLSNSDDDEDEDISYVPEIERPDTPPTKKRKVRRDTVRNVYSNGYQDHEYSFSKRKMTKTEPDPDPEDMMLACEQTMIEGDTEIINTDDTVCKDNSQDSSVPVKICQEKKQPSIIRQIPSPQRLPIPIQPYPQRQAQQQKQQQSQGQKLMLNNSMAINPVPLANLLKVALSSGAKKIKVTHTNQKLVAVPMTMIPKSVASSSVTFVKPRTHFLVPKTVAKNFQQNSMLSQQQQHSHPTEQQSQPSVIDIDSDDEPVILENSNNNNNNNNNTHLNTNSHTNSVSYSPPTIVNESGAVEENVIPDQVDYMEDEPVYLSTIESTRTTMNSARSRLESDQPVITIDGVIPLKLQKREQRFKKMLILQSQEIDNTVGDLKTKILKLIQMAENAKQDADPLGSASLCTKRFHRALRKTLVELSHINDRVVRDFVHWKKRTPNALGLKAEKTDENVIERGNKIGSRRKSKVSNDDLVLEMICVRDSASESESDDDIEELNVAEEHTLEATETPIEFSQILDHLSIFKRKPTALKAVGDSSVLTEDKACQAYDVPWRDYEKCIGYSLVTRAEYDAESQEVIQRPAVVPDENFGKYQEQFLYYLQHIEDHGIETDELKGLPDPNHIPLKDLIDGSSPFIMDMLERLSPVTLSNGCTSPNQAAGETSSKPDTVSDKPSSPSAMETSETVESENIPLEMPTENANDDQKTENKPMEDVAATSKDIEKLVKMVTKLSEDFRSERKETDDELETLAAVNSILEPDEASNQENKQKDAEEVASNHTSNDECTTID